MNMRQKSTITGMTAAVGAAVLACALAFGFDGGLATQQSAEELYQAALLKQEAEGDLNGAIKLLEDLIAKFPGKRDIAAKAQLQIGACYEKLGLKQAQEAYRKVIDTYPDQGEAVQAAREKLAVLARAGTDRPSESREMKVRRVFDDYGPEWGNAVSSDGRHLVYTDWSTGDMAVVDLVTKQRRPITKDGGMDTSKGGFGETSAFSADDKRIAYGYQGRDSVSELRVIDFDGTDPSVLCRDENAIWIRPHAWSPDGRSLLALFMRKDGTSEIATISLVDKKVTVIRKVDAKNPQIALSPDGALIAYSMAPDRGSGKRDVFLMNWDGSGHEAIVSAPGDDYVLGWSPDGCRLVFASDRTGSCGVWSVRIKDGRVDGSPQWLKSDLTPDPLRLTPDGTLHYMSFESAFDVYTAPIDPVTGRPLAPPAAVRSRRAGIRTGPDWSLDGKSLAFKFFASTEDKSRTQAQITILDLATGEEVQVDSGVTSPNPYMGVRWSPDGNSVLLIGTKSDTEEGIYQVGIPGGETRILIRFPPQKHCLQAAWSLDGQSIFYFLGGNPSRLLRRDLASGTDAELAAMDSAIGWPRLAVSPDGKQVAFTSIEKAVGPPTLMIVPAAGGPAREILKLGDRGFAQWLFWSPDGKEIWTKLYRSAPDGQGQPSIEYLAVSPDGGAVRTLELGAKQGDQTAPWQILSAMDLRLSPDGRQVAFWAGQSKLELWALENFLPDKK
jgi:Tol biopolymer transport system component